MESPVYLSAESSLSRVMLPGDQDADCGGGAVSAVLGTEHHHGRLYQPWAETVQ